MNAQLFKLVVILPTVGLVSACGMKTVKRDEPAPVIAAAVPTPHEVEHSRTPSQVEKKTVAVSHHQEPKGVAPDQALKWLKNGNTRYTKGFLRKDGQSHSDIERLSKGQQPHSIVLSCSDSRVPPEIVFDQKLGEIFTVRTAGEAINSNVIASIEYAIEHLGSRLIVVMGHTSCGAVKAAAATINGGDAGSPALNKLVADIHPRIRPVLDRHPASADVAEESFSNAEGAVQDLMKRSAIIREAVASGKVQMKSALYHLGSGKVEFQP